MTAFWLGLYILIFPVAALGVLAVIVYASIREFREARSKSDIV